MTLQSYKKKSVNSRERIIRFQQLGCDSVIVWSHCKVQAMRDGNVYVTELPKRIHSTPLFREDNSTLTLGRNGKYYFVFMLPQALVDELPDRLVQQALAIAQKVERMTAGRVEK